MNEKSTIKIFLLLVIGIPLLGYGLYSWLDQNLSQPPIFGNDKFLNGKKVEHTIEDFQLLDQNGSIVNTNAWGNRIVIVDFFFTRCPVVCPKMTSSLKKVQSSFPEDKILINSFTVDPDFDRPEELKKYASKFGINESNWTLLTGSKKDIYRLARNSFMLVATDGDGGPDDFIHSENLVLLDSKRRIRGFYDGTDEKQVNQLIKDIKKLR